MKRCRASGSSLLLTESGTRRDGPPAAQRQRDRRDTGAMRTDVVVSPGRIAKIGWQLSLRADLEQDVGRAGRVPPGFIDAHPWRSSMIS
jgi:imidazolonepropionase-like amidohydrolase